MPGGPGHARTAAELIAWATDSCTGRPAGLGGGVPADRAVQAAQVHALLAVAEAVQFLAGMQLGANDDLAEELRESRGALVDELTEVRSDLAAELDGIREVLDARQLGWRARRRLRRAAQVRVLPVLPDGAAELAADGDVR